MMKRICVGVLAHVDAGKTTLGEAVLYRAGVVRTQGRVDSGTSALDTDAQEKERGITILSKQTRFVWPSSEPCEILWLDTPGHVDFSAETERVLSVLDCAILVISATDGVQTHTKTLWDLLRKRRIPTFLFVNKMDLPNPGEKTIAHALQKEWGTSLFPFYSEEDEQTQTERLATASEDILETYMETGKVDRADIAELVADCELYPVYFGVALHNSGIDALIDGICTFRREETYPEAFGAQVIKITYDRTGARLTWMRLRGGSLTVRQELSYESLHGEAVTEKITAIRLYTGEKFTQADTVCAGDICVIPGLSATYAGQGLGSEADDVSPTLQPVLGYRLRLPAQVDPRVLYPKLRELADEDPMLHLTWEEEKREIRVLLMGQVQTEVLTRRIKDRFDVEIGLDEGEILYRETVAVPVEGVGHYEPLRHYAEVHLLIEPLPPGCGVVLDSKCAENDLARNWQRLILSELSEKEHRGVLTGAPLTDVRITLLSGRAHIKHTDGGDFRQASLRAVRQGLMQANNVLLEPMYRYTLTVPTACVGQAMTELDRRCAQIQIEDDGAGQSTLSGRVPVSTVQNYAREVASYTHGEGKLSLIPDGYAPCHNTEEVLEQTRYDPSADLQNPSYSVFCANGAGFMVPWDQVYRYMHLESAFEAAMAQKEEPEELLPTPRMIARTYDIDTEELEAIMLREFGPMKRRSYREPKLHGNAGDVAKEERRRKHPHKPVKPILLVDGYNLIHAWEPLERLARESLEHARKSLQETLAGYVAYTGCELTLVYDAYLVKDGSEHREEVDGFTVCYTAENVTADTWIEQMMYKLGPNLGVKIVSSDKLIQFSAVSAGVVRISAREFIDEIERIHAEISAFCTHLALHNRYH